jgi:hypothetical protein
MKYNRALSIIAFVASTVLLDIPVSSRPQAERRALRQRVLFLMSLELWHARNPAPRRKPDLEIVMFDKVLDVENAGDRKVIVAQRNAVRG